MGTPFYLAPEIWMDKPCSKKTDVWALGVILYEICALLVPFQAEEMDELEGRVLKEKPTPLPNYVSKHLASTIQQEFHTKDKFVSITLQQS